jgi:non-ribosomal peptide synthetase component F
MRNSTRGSTSSKSRQGAYSVSQALDRTDELSAEEKRALLARLLREKAAARAAEACVHRLFEAQAARTPEATAWPSRAAR